MKILETGLDKVNAFSINCNGRLIDLSKPKIMGILNLTPDSFSDGGLFNQPSNALRHVEHLLKDGAEIIDIGAQSTRPQAKLLSADEEIVRLGSIIENIKKEFPHALVSLDSFYGKVVSYAFGQGVDIINDISAGQYDDTLWDEVAKTKLPYILMHSNSSYATMHDKIEYPDIILELNRFFSNKIAQLQALGINDVIVDPGFGFSKTEHNQMQIIDELNWIGYGEFPILIGISRKSFIYKPLKKGPLEINSEMHQLHQKLYRKGACIFRVHEPALLQF